MIERSDYKVVFFEWRYRETIYKYTLGLHYLSAVLRKASYTVWDKIFEEESSEEVSEQLLKLSPNLIGIHYYREIEKVTFDFARRIKEANPEIKVMLGGHTASLFAAKILNDCEYIDLISFGEGERTLEEICDRFRKGEELDGCKGVMFRKNGFIHRNEDRPLIENLDELPFPSIDVLKEKHTSNKCVFGAISTSRGCLGKCGFCVTSRIFKKEYKNAEWRGRSPKNVVEELKKLIAAFPDKRMVYRIVDGSFEDPDPIQKTRVKEIISLFEQENIRVPFGILTRAESWKEEDLSLLKRMRDVGLYEAGIGFEACTERSMKKLNKRATVEDNYRAKELFTKSGIDVFAFLIMFHPYTLFEELKQNAEFLLNMDMAYHTQNWTSELFLWPDSRMLPNLIQDGLLLGPEKIGYQMQYAFEDGRVSKVVKIMRKIGESNITNEFIWKIEKIKLENLLYDTWKSQYPEMLVIEDSMREYKEYYFTERAEIGLRQYEFFMDLWELIKNDSSAHRIENSLEAWIQYIDAKDKVLQHNWMKYKMQQGRKKIILI